MLLRFCDPAPVRIDNAQGRSPFLLIGDHAGNRVPDALDSLGLPPEELSRHIGWDIGIAALGRAMANRLDAPFVSQVYSRLVIDCNRDPAAADAIPEVSDGTPVPGNAALAPAARAARVDSIHAPYHHAIAQEIARRNAAGMPTLLVALHSFTPALSVMGAGRPWQVGVLHDRGDLRLAHALLAVLREEPSFTVGDNEPYRMDGIDHSVPRHAYPAALPYAEIEVRQDLLADEAGVAAWSARLCAALEAAAAGMGNVPG